MEWKCTCSSVRITVPTVVSEAHVCSFFRSVIIPVRSTLYLSCNMMYPILSKSIEGDSVGKVYVLYFYIPPFVYLYLL